MNSIKIDKIVAKNFKSIGGMKAKLDLSDKGLVHISGKNGLGKSTILSIITFGLYGKNVDLKSNGKSSIPAKNLINDINKKELEVEVYLSNGYVIKRGISPDYFYIEKDGDNLANKSSKTIDQDFLENEILGGLDFQSFMSTIYLSSKALSTPFLYMSPSQRKEFIENILDLRIIYYMNEVTKKKISENKLDYMNLSEKINLLKNNIASAEESIQKQEEKQRIQEEESDRLLEEAKQKFIEYRDNTFKELKNLDFELNMCQTDIKYTEQELNTKMSEVKEKPKDIEDEIRNIKDNIRKIDEERFRRQSEKDVFDKNLERFKLCGSCPTVKQIVGEYDTQSFEDFIEQAEDYIERFNDSLKVQEHKLNKAEMLNDKIVELQSKLKEHTTNEQYIKEKIDRLKSDLESKKESYDMYKESLSKKIEIDYTHLNTMKSDYKKYSKEYDIVVEQKDNLENIKKIVNDKSIKEEVIQHYVPIFESKVNELLEKFMADDDFSFKVSIGSTFEVDGFKNGKKFNLFGLSSGQLSSVHFAFLFGFLYILELKNLINFNMLFIDELMDSSGLDTDRLQYILDYIKELSYNKDIFVVTHNKTINLEMFDNQLLVEKVQKFTEYSWR